MQDFIIFQGGLWVWLNILILQFQFSASEIQMMAIPQGQYVITETAVGTPVTTVNTGQVKAVTQVSKRIMAFSFCLE